MANSYRGYGKSNSSTIILKWYKNPEHPSHPHYFILSFMWGRNQSNQIHCQFIIDKKKNVVKIASLLGTKKIVKIDNL